MIFSSYSRCVVSLFVVRRSVSNGIAAPYYIIRIDSTSKSGKNTQCIRMYARIRWIHLHITLSLDTIRCANYCSFYLLFTLWLRFAIAGFPGTLTYHTKYNKIEDHFTHIQANRKCAQQRDDAVIAEQQQEIGTTCLRIKKIRLALFSFGRVFIISMK